MNMVEYRKFLPEGIDKEPETVLEALRAAREVFAEEGRWMTGDWFHNAHPEVDPEDPFCNSWSACIEGGVALVTIGAMRVTTPDELLPVDGYAHRPTAGQMGLSAGKWASVRVSGLPGYDLYREACKALTEMGPQALAKRLHAKEIGPDEVEHVTHWFNDSVCQTRTDVLDWFDKTIEHVKSTQDKVDATAG